MVLNIEPLLAEYHALLNRGEYYSALIRCAQAASVSDEDSKQLLGVSARKRLGQKEISVATKKASDEASKLTRLVGVPGELQDEEIYQIVSLRLDLGMFESIVTLLSGTRPDLRLLQVDQAITDLRKRSGALDRRFREVIRSIRANSGLALPGTSVDEFL